MFRIVRTAGLALALVLGSGAAAQIANIPPARVPAEGIAILDCAPPPPSPEQSCLLRVPPLHERGQLRSNSVGDEEASFEFIQPGDYQFPPEVALSGTLLLIDLSPGLGGGRSATLATEKQLLNKIAAGLPDGELVAVYGFNERIERLSGFTDNRESTIRAVDAIGLKGVNTRISTFVLDAIEVLAERDDMLFKNLILVSDGEEEGIEAMPEITQAAIDAGVSISALGMFWRPVGTEQTGAGMDYLHRITEGSHGAAVQVLLPRSGEAEQAVERFLDGFASSRRSSGLIVPEGPARAADISVRITPPELGSSSRFDEGDVTVRFRPLQAPQPGPLPRPPEPEPWTILGLPAPVALGIGGVALAVLLAGAAFALLRGRSPEEEEEVLPEELQTAGFAPAGGQTDFGSAPTVAVVRPPAHLVREDTGESTPISDRRVAIGRSSANAVVLSDDSISRVHAELHRNREGGFSLTDMQSLNGTYINDAKVKGTALVKNGDNLRFGNVRVRFILS